MSRVTANERLVPTAEREYWADNLRVLVIAAVVVFHTATAYIGGTSWYFMQRATGAWTGALTLPAEVVAAFALGPLFLIAGWFSARSLAHRGAGAFARARLLRLGVPLIAFVCLVNGLTSYVGHLGPGPHPSLEDFLGGSFALGPMWFVAALLAFSLAYAVFRQLRVPPVRRRRSAAQVMMAAAVLIAVTSFAVFQRWPLDDGNTFMNARWESWPQGAMLFGLGVWAGEAGRLEDLTAQARRLGWTALGAVALLGTLVGYENARGNFQSVLQGTGWPAMLASVLYGVVSVAFTVWFTALVRSRWTGHGPLRARAAQASYASYFLHPLPVTAIMVAIAQAALAPGLKFLIVAALGVPVCFLAGYALTRLPSIARARPAGSRGDIAAVHVSRASGIG